MPSWVLLSDKCRPQTYCCLGKAFPSLLCNSTVKWLEIPLGSKCRLPTCFSDLSLPPQVLLPPLVPRDSPSSVLPPPPLGLEVVRPSLPLPGIWRAKRKNCIWEGWTRDILAWDPGGGDWRTSTSCGSIRQEKAGKLCWTPIRLMSVPFPLTPQPSFLFMWQCDKLIGERMWDKVYCWLLSYKTFPRDKIAFSLWNPGALTLGDLHLRVLGRVSEMPGLTLEEPRQCS